MLGRVLAKNTSLEIKYLYHISAQETLLSLYVYVSKVCLPNMIYQFIIIIKAEQYLYDHFVCLFGGVYRHFQQSFSYIVTVSF
jgi:hypothetical protein